MVKGVANLLLSLLVFGCTSNAESGLRPAQLQKNYPHLLASEIPDRIGLIPSVLLDDLMKMDSKPSYEPHELSPDERELFYGTLAKLPGFLLDSLQTEVMAIYLVKNFSGGGMTYAVWDGGRAKYILLFNPLTLHQSLSQWLSYRDNTALDGLNSPYSLRETETGDSIGFLHTLVHEACHVYDYAHSVTGTPEGELSALSRESWKDLMTARPESDFPSRTKLHFYDFEAKAKVPIQDLVLGFDAFTAAGFASLYGSGNAMDDFAETLTYVLLDQEFSVRLTLEVLKDGKVVKSYTPATSPLVLEKYRSIENASMKLTKLTPSSQETWSTTSDPN